MPGNYSIQVRNIDEYTFNKLNEMAEKAGMTREGYLRKMLSNYALSEEIKRVEDKYTTLVKNLVEYIQMQGEIIEQNRFKLKGKPYVMRSLKVSIGNLKSILKNEKEKALNMKIYRENEWNAEMKAKKERESEVL